MGGLVRRSFKGDKEISILFLWRSGVNDWNYYVLSRTTNRKILGLIRFKR